MATITAQPMASAGLTPVYAPVNASDQFANDSASLLFLHVKNANAAACTVTITDPGSTPYGSAASNPTRVVPANTGDKMYPIPGTLANASGIITVAYSVTASVTAAVVAVPK